MKSNKPSLDERPRGKIGILASGNTDRELQTINTTYGGVKVLGAYKDSMKKLNSVHHPPMYRKESVINLIQKMSTRGESQDLTASKEHKVAFGRECSMWDMLMRSRQLKKQRS